MQVCFEQLFHRFLNFVIVYITMFLTTVTPKMGLEDALNARLKAP